MTVIVEQAARVADGLLYGPEALVRPKGRDIAQSLADAGLLAQPARTVPHRDEVAAAIAQGYEPENPTPNRHDYRAADAVLELMADQPTDLELDSAQQRLYAWEQIAGHPFFAECFDSEGTLIDAMIYKLDKEVTIDTPLEKELAKRTET